MTRVHYTSPMATWALRPSCGNRRARAITDVLGDVTCAKCRGTLVYRMDDISAANPRLTRTTVRRMAEGRAS